MVAAEAGDTVRSTLPRWHGDPVIIGVFLGSGVVTKEAISPAEALAGIFDADIELIGLTLDPVAGIEPGESFQPAVTLAAAEPHVLVIPGGFGVRPMAGDRDIVGRIRHIAVRADGVLTVSTGTLLLAATELLAGTQAAGHWLTRAELEPYGVDLSERTIERHGRLFTTAGAIAAVEAVPELADVILYGPPP